jgi:hypothetical protein
MRGKTGLAAFSGKQGFFGRRNRTMNKHPFFRRIVFYWAASFAFSLLAYYALRLVLPYPFACLEFAPCFYHEYPARYILIPCFFYSVLASILANRFARASVLGQVFLTIALFVLVILISSPFGGTLEYFHLMQAQQRPLHIWYYDMIRDGAMNGLYAGWYVILLSVPYNLICVTACFFVTRRGANIH